MGYHDRYEEEAKADFDAWQHEAPEPKSPSLFFEKQMLLVYTQMKQINNDFEHIN